MKVFLFLFPVREYVEGVYGIFGTPELHGYSPGRLDELIHERYRRRGYKVYWLVFSKEGRPEIPDLSRTTDVVTVCVEDEIVVAGVSFKRHCDEKQYPEPGYILSQIPTPLDRLVLGGFHQNDCVERVARFAHGLGVDVIVDEDTTEHFFISSTVLKGNIPLNRESRSFDVFWPQVGSEERGANEVLKDIERKKREGRPWLVQ